MRLKTYKYRLYPTKEQEILLAKTFGCARYVYNRALELKTSIYEQTKKSISVFDLMKNVVKWKDDEETEWLKEVNSQALQVSLVNLDRAFTNFFKKRAEFPKFKAKYCNEQAFGNPQNTTVDWEVGKIYIPKFGNGIKSVLSRKFEGKIKTSTVTKTPSGKYYISILVEEDVKNKKRKRPKEDKTLGIDLGIANYATFSDGTIIENPKHLKNALKRLKRHNRRLSRKQKGSKNRDKQRRKLSRAHEKVANQRKDFLHKLSKRIVDNQDYTSAAIEDLDVAGMLQKGRKNKLSRYISDAGWGMFRQFLTYKCEWYGKNLLVIGRFEPSSRLCSCGCLNNNLTLKDREWTCQNCKIHHNRDTLAAQNIKRFAFCKQNTSSVPQELREFTLVESGVSRSLKQEASIPLG